jgi:hypothetical protein
LSASAICLQIRWIERVFRGLKQGDWLGWNPTYHWTDRKIRIHAFYCLLGISLLHYAHRQAQAAWADLSVEQLLAELAQIKQFVLLYPPQGEKGPPRTAYVLAGTSRLRRLAAYTRCHCCAYSHRPRQPMTGSELSLMLFHDMSSSETTGNFSAAFTQFFTENSGLQLGITVSAFPSSSHSDSGEVCVFEA